MSCVVIEEESERGLAACGARGACGALLRRAWRPAALVRLCRCARRRACDTPAPAPRRTPLNNWAHLQFCDPITDWPECSIYDTALTVETSYERMNPDELEEMHHRGIQLTPPKITLTCRCREPNYWKLINTTEDGTVRTYKCASLPPCKSGDFCGNVNYELNSLYQSCLCPRNHMCEHNGGVTHMQISELLYQGKGWKAYCQPISDDYTYEDY
ncbi:uncharacterized protein [Epargyreus clarus]|uniref:uncharacterized protein n=1 Tax=Epargyreus clarus TaxID=520877 RepID=UPI003C2D3064